MQIITVDSVANAIDEYLVSDHVRGLGGATTWLLPSGEAGITLDENWAHPGFIGVFYRNVRVVLLDETMPLDLAVRLVIAALEYQSDDENGELEIKSRVRA